MSGDGPVNDDGKPSNRLAPANGAPPSNSAPLSSGAPIDVDTPIDVASTPINPSAPIDVASTTIRTNTEGSAGTPIGNRTQVATDAPGSTGTPVTVITVISTGARLRSDLQNRLFVWMQYLLPQHALSRLVLAATRVRTPWFKDALTRGFLKLFVVDMNDAVQKDPHAFASFNEFFTRALRPETRPVDANLRTITSPVDGAVSECGSIEKNRLLQAKGRHYSLNDLLARQPWAKRFEGGSFATIYLAPYNYHRIHMPVRGTLLDTVYVPGRLFSVNTVTAQHVPRLFARNERVLTLFETEFGQFALVMVGALNVGSMATVWAGDITPAARRAITRMPLPSLTLAKGAELGRFNMGSTVIVLFEPNRVQWDPALRAGSLVQLGQAIGTAT